MPHHLGKAYREVMKKYLSFVKMSMKEIGKRPSSYRDEHKRDLYSQENDTISSTFTILWANEEESLSVLFHRTEQQFYHTHGLRRGLTNSPPPSCIRTLRKRFIYFDCGISYQKSQIGNLLSVLFTILCQKWDFSFFVRKMS